MSLSLRRFVTTSLIIGSCPEDPQQLAVARPQKIHQWLIVARQEDRQQLVVAIHHRFVIIGSLRQVITPI